MAILAYSSWLETQIQGNNATKQQPKFSNEEFAIKQFNEWVKPKPFLDPNKPWDPHWKSVELAYFIYVANQSGKFAKVMGEAIHNAAVSDQKTPNKTIVDFLLEESREIKSGVRDLGPKLSETEQKIKQKNKAETLFLQALLDFEFVFENSFKQLFLDAAREATAAEKTKTTVSNASSASSSHKNDKDRERRDLYNLEAKKYSIKILAPDLRFPAAVINLSLLQQLPGLLAIKTNADDKSTQVVAEQSTATDWREKLTFLRILKKIGKKKDSTTAAGAILHRILNAFFYDWEGDPSWGAKDAVSSKINICVSWAKTHPGILEWVLQEDSLSTKVSKKTTQSIKKALTLEHLLDLLSAWSIDGNNKQEQACKKICERILEQHVGLGDNSLDYRKELEKRGIELFEKQNELISGLKLKSNQANTTERKIIEQEIMVREGFAQLGKNAIQAIAQAKEGKYTDFKELKDQFAWLDGVKAEEEHRKEHEKEENRKKVEKLQQAPSEELDKLRRENAAKDQEAERLRRENEDQAQQLALLRALLDQQQREHEEKEKLQQQQRENEEKLQQQQSTPIHEDTPNNNNISVVVAVAPPPTTTPARSNSNNNHNIEFSPIRPNTTNDDDDDNPFAFSPPREIEIINRDAPATGATTRTVGSIGEENEIGTETIMKTTANSSANTLHNRALDFSEVASNGNGIHDTSEAHSLANFVKAAAKSVQELAAEQSKKRAEDIEKFKQSAPSQLILRHSAKLFTNAQREEVVTTDDDNKTTDKTRGRIQSLNSFFAPKKITN